MIPDQFAGRSFQIQPTMKEDFIGVWDNRVPPDQCGRIITLFENSTQVNGRNYHRVQDRQLDVGAFHPDIAHDVMNYVRFCLQDYIEWYPYLNGWNFHSSGCLVQKTEPTEGYHTFHAENCEQTCSSRTLVWTIYFNDVDERRETEFLYQQQNVKPKAGRADIYPGSFTHLHPGNPPMSTKNIATGWFSTGNPLSSNLILAGNP